MKKAILTRLAFALMVLFTTEAFSQLDTSFSLPPGYSGVQLRNRNVLKIDPSGHTWIGFRFIGAGTFDGTTWTMYNQTNSGLPRNNVKAIAFDGNITWLGTDSGLARYDGVSWTVYDSINSGLFANNIKLLFAQGGNLWIATESGGVEQYDGTTWMHHTLATGLVNDTVLCFGARNNSVFIGTQNGISEFRGGSWYNYHTGTLFTDTNKIVSIAGDGNDTLFVSPAQGGLYMLAGASFWPASAFMSLSCGDTYAGPLKLMKSNNGSILAFGLDGEWFYEFSSSTFSLVNYNLYMANAYHNAFKPEQCDVDPQGRIWYVNTILTNLLYRIDYLNYWPQQGPLPAGHAELNINEVRARLHNNGDNFWDGIGSAKYEVPKNTCGQSALFSQGLWLGGLDQTNKLHMAAQTYRQSGSDFWPGPLDTITCMSDSVSSAQFNHIWVLERATINDFITNFSNGNVANGTWQIPHDMLTWPGNGTGSFYQYLAPFVDVDLNGFYDPYSGDYPDIKGDQMAWWVMNDSLYPHGETGGAAFGVQIQVSAYAYNCPWVADSEKTINYTTFYSYKIINMSIADYHDVYLGLFTDVDLGNYSDDFVGCDVDHDFAYGYNGDLKDEGSQGYGLNPPVISVALLGGPYADMADAVDNNHNGIIDEPFEKCMLNHFMYYDNDFTNFGNPVQQYDYYRYMQSIWKNAVHATYGANGHTGSDSCNYMFPGSSDPSGYGTNGVPQSPWDEYSAGNTPSDRRFVMSSGPFSFSSGEITYLDFAIVYTRDPIPASFPRNFAYNLAEVQKVKNWWNSNTYPSNCVGPNGIPDPAGQPAQGLVLYPNPAEVGFFVDVNIRKPHAPLHYEMKDVTGRILKSGTLSVSGQYIALNGVARGMYFIHVYGDGFSASAKLIHR